jgi:cobalt/nickel transport system permease protein
LILAVHISDGVLSPIWLAGGFLGAAVLIVLGAWRIRDDDLPRVALLTAAFFVVSFIHVNVGPTSVHLLLTGLLGVILGRRAALAIPVALFFQAVLAQHGGITALGVNSVILTVPALLAWQMYQAFEAVPWGRRPWFRELLVALCTFSWILSVVFSFALLLSNRGSRLSQVDPSSAIMATLHPLTLVIALAVCGIVAYVECRLENAPEFPIGLLIGEMTVLATVALNGLVLRWGGQEDWPALVLVMLVPHVFIAMIEGVVLGFTVGFLARTRPGLLIGHNPEARAWAAPPAS